MKILHVITSLRTGGAEKLLVDLIPRFKQMGHTVDLLLLDGTPTPFKHDAEKAGITIHHLGIGGSVYSPLKLLKLLKYLPEYDVVHTHNYAPQLFAAIGSMLCSVVLCTTEHNTSNRRRNWKWFKPIDKWMYSRYKKIISISPKTQELLQEHIKATSSDRFITIYNGIDSSHFKSAIPANLHKEDFNCRIAIIQVAGFRHQKDQDTTIKALKYLSDDIHLFLVGDGIRRPELEKLTKEEHLESRVHFLGIRSDVAELLKSANIAVISSHWEGFGLAAVEAMAAGTPVIASDVDGLREVVDGAGILFPDGDSKTLAKEIMKLEGDPELYEKTAIACHERVMQFDISKMVEGYMKIYSQVIE
ncbi:MAG: glycosyltransferase [Bacteroides sp.]|nr:glycosyltransferase [Bacteroides sp.]